MRASRRPPRFGFQPILAALVVAALGVLAWRSGLIGPTDRGNAAAASTPGGNVRPPALGATPTSSTPIQGAGGARLPSRSAQQAALDRLITLGLPLFCGGGDGNSVALTFDDGPGPYTAQALDILSANGATATFFAVGRNIDAWPGLLERERAIGAVGDHTWTHVVLSGLTAQQLDHEIGDTQQAAQAASGGPVSLFRPPLGLHTPEVDARVKALGMVQVMWSVDSMDSVGATPAQELAFVRAGLFPGAIVLMHENRGSTRRDLPTILADIRAAGLRTVTIPQLLALDPPSVQDLRLNAGARECVRLNHLSPSASASPTSTPAG